MTNEELVAAIRGGDETAYEELLRNLAPIILHEAEIYRGKMDYYQAELHKQPLNRVKTHSKT